MLEESHRKEKAQVGKFSLTGRYRPRARRGAGDGEHLTCLLKGKGGRDYKQRVMPSKGFGKEM